MSSKANNFNVTSMTSNSSSGGSNNNNTTKSTMIGTLNADSVVDDGNVLTSVHNSSHSEQPQTKRQKIEKVRNTTQYHHHHATSIPRTATTATVTTPNAKVTTQPDVLDPGEEQMTVLTQQHTNCKNHFCSSLSSSANSISMPSSLNDSPTSTPSTSRTTSLSQLLNVQTLAGANVAAKINLQPMMPRAAAAGSEAAETTAPSKALITNNNSNHNNSSNNNGTILSYNSRPLSSITNDGSLNCASSAYGITNDEVDRSILPTTTPMIIGSDAIDEHRDKKMTTAAPTFDASSTARDMREFESSLSRQCLCGVSEHTLRKPFQSHFSKDTNGQRRIANLNEWPTKKLVQFLSNLQLLFDIYLKQNSKGFICGRIMDVCDALIRNDNNLIDEIIGLANYNNAYVQFLASRVLAAFLVIAKQEMNDDWLKNLIDNLFNSNNLDHVAVQRIHFSLDIIKRIVEWKDIDLHPLEDEIVDPSESISGNVNVMVAATEQTTRLEYAHEVGYLHFQTQQPTLETNYFAMHFQTLNDNVEEQVAVATNNHFSHHVNDVNGGGGGGGGGSSNSSGSSQELLSLYYPTRPLTTPITMINAESVLPHLTAHNVGIVGDDGGGNDGAVNNSTTASAELLSSCHIVTLTDSESFDTTHLKCIAIKILENKWPGLVKKMSELIANYQSIENAEICILNFLELWENIISVKANLSIVETLPFYAQLEKLQLLLNQHLSCTVYKQMLSLFNEALCYGSTLALQDMLPNETCRLAHKIVRHVKDFRMLETLPRRQPENAVSFIGYERPSIVYEEGTIHSTFMQQSLLLPQHAHLTSSPLAGNDVIEMDKTILQKMVLLVLKSIAVMVKEIRSDSSDSSIDSTDFDAYQDMVLILRSIHDVLQKLEAFIKQTLEFHPECHFSKILIHLFDDQDDHLIEAMVCTLDVTAGISFRNNAFPDLVLMLNPVYTFLEFLKMTSNSSDLLLDLLVSNETCFLLYLLRFLKYIRMNWSLFVRSCNDFTVNVTITNPNNNNIMLDEAMSVLIRLRLQISRLVSRQLYPYDISPVLRLLESCESLYEGNELS